jgi:hypothetical protein
LGERDLEVLKKLAGRQGFEPMLNEPRRVEMCLKQGFELGAGLFSKVVMARDFWF